MTNTQLLITARLAHQEAARIFAEVAGLRDANGAMYQRAADSLHQAALDYAAVATVTDMQTLYLPEPGIRERLEAWKPADDEGWSDPEPPAVAAEGGQW